jgi:Zn-dependent protease with chaperone function
LLIYCYKAINYLLANGAFMTVINFLNPTFKMTTVIAGSSSAVMLGLYAGFGSAAITPIIVTTALSSGFIFASSYYSRSMIDYMYSASSIKLDESHPLTKSAREVASLNPDFKHLNKVEIFLTAETTPNAFACGFTKKDAAIYVSQGLINCFAQGYSDLRVKAIFAHELGHISGSHIQINTAVKVLDVVSDAAVLVIERDVKSSLGKSKAKTKDKKEKSKDDSSAKFIYKAGLWASLKVFKHFGLSMISRQLEYEADRAAHKSGLGHELKEALLKISHSSHHNSFANGVSSLAKEFISTHPSTVNRLIALDFAAKEDVMDHTKGGIDSIINSVKYSVGRYVLETTSHFNQMTILNDIMPHYIENNGYQVFKHDPHGDGVYHFVEDVLVAAAAPADHGLAFG